MAYTLKGKKCGTVRFAPTGGTVTKESLNKTSKVTSNPVEQGADINDHVVTNPAQLSLTGVVVGGQSAADRLDAMWKKGDLITYAGRNRIDSLVITSLKMDSDAKNKNGFSFSLTFQRVNISSSEYVALGEKPLMSQQDGGGLKNDGLKTVSENTISSGAYKDYVDSYNNKPASSSGPASRQSPSYSGIR